MQGRCCGHWKQSSKAAPCTYLLATLQIHNSARTSMRYILVECQCFSAKFMPNPAQEEQGYPACSHPRDSSIARTWTWRTRVDISHKAIRCRVCRGDGLFFRVKGHHRRDRSEDIL